MGYLMLEFMAAYGSWASCIGTSPFPSRICGLAMGDAADDAWCGFNPPWYWSYLKPAGGC